MSRIGKQPIPIPAGVTIAVDSNEITVSGSKGTLKQFTMPNITVRQDGDTLFIERANEDAETKAKHGLLRALINNMIQGVSQGFNKKLELNGVGYRAAMAGSDLRLSVGFSHDIVYKLVPGVTAAIEQNVITISGIDKQQVGQVAAEIRAFKKPEPYKGKGIKYSDERIIRKSGKSGKEK